MHKSRQAGFAHAELIIVIIVAVIVSLIFFKVAHKEADKKVEPKATITSAAGEDVKWFYNDQTRKWQASGEAPSCPEPLAIKSPSDVRSATAVLYPGQYRGGDYKAHGGLRYDNTPDGKVTVSLPMDATLIGANRYYESPDGAIQYLVDFVNDCGIAFRFDHLFTLTDKLQAAMDKMPPPKLDDTRSDPNIKPEPVKFKAGEVIATAVGHPAIPNIGYDFGLYDLRQTNEISKNNKWAALHATNQSYAYHAVCWLDYVPQADGDFLKALPPPNSAQPGTISDYCSNAKHKTLEINGGQPYRSAG